MRAHSDTRKHSSTAKISINNAQLSINREAEFPHVPFHASLQSLDSFINHKIMFTIYGVPVILFPCFSLVFRWRACSLSTRWWPRRMIWTSGYIYAMSFYDVASRRSCLWVTKTTQLNHWGKDPYSFIPKVVLKATVIVMLKFFKHK